MDSPRSRRRRPHAAANARKVAGVLSAGGLVAMTAFLALDPAQPATIAASATASSTTSSTSSASASASNSTSSASTSATTSTTRTTVPRAVTSTPSASAVTKSGGS
jgi:hypothetical protein